MQVVHPILKLYHVTKIHLWSPLNMKENYLLNIL